MFYYTFADTYISSVRTALDAQLDSLGVAYQNFDGNNNQTTQNEQIQTALTDGYNLPARYVIHTVGPIANGRPTDTHRRQLAECYRACLDATAKAGLSSIAFCCISTGEFHFPNETAAEIAVETVENYLKENGYPIKVIFNVFKDEDFIIYKKLLTP